MKQINIYLVSGKQVDGYEVYWWIHMNMIWWYKLQEIYFCYELKEYRETIVEVTKKLDKTWAEATEEEEEEDALGNIVRKQKYDLYLILVYVNKNYEEETYFDVCRILFKHEPKSNNALHIISLHFNVCKIIFKS